jgi:segregation and condensation protein A
VDVKLEAYEGPLDLLLKLIKKNEVDIYDIPVAQITEEYMQVIEALPPDMEQMSEFLVMAATLLEIKSKMLLPRAKIENETEEDPREALAQQLIAYKQAQELAAHLRLAPFGERLIGRGDKDVFVQLTISDEPPMELITIPQLEKIFAEIMRRAEDKIDTVRAGYGEMQREKITVTDKIAFISKALKSNGRIGLSSLFSDCGSRHEMIVTFLALLEMVRRGIITASQTAPFEDVELQAIGDIKCPG